MKIVILGSCRFAPYNIIAVPDPIPGLHNTERGYQKSTEKFYPSIAESDEVWIYAPDGLGEHTRRDLEFTLKLRKTIRWVAWDGRVLA